MKKNIDKQQDILLRQKAELLLKSKRTVKQFDESDFFKLIHELEVHQIELELQNEELVEAKDKAEREAKYVELYDFAPSGYVTLSADSLIVQLNLSTAKLLGNSRINLVSMPFINFVSDDTKLVFEKFIQKSHSANNKENCEIIIHKPNLPLLYLLVEGISSTTDDLIHLTLVDITARKLIDIAYNARDKAEDSDRLKSAFLQNMSHEIRSPMNAIMGFSEILPEYYNNKEKVELFSNIIHQRSNDLLDIINDILDISKIESGQLSIFMEKIDLKILLDELYVFFTEQQQKLNNQRVNLKIDTMLDPSIKIIISDKIKLKQILINLISNAFKFTENGEINVSCKINIYNQLEFIVIDTGIGIPIEKQKIIFERFYQFHQGLTHNTGGTGLGLSIVQGLVNLLGGEVVLLSEPGFGSAFSFSIPYKSVQFKKINTEKQ